MPERFRALTSNPFPAALSEFSDEVSTNNEWLQHLIELAGMRDKFLSTLKGADESFRPETFDDEEVVLLIEDLIDETEAENNKWCEGDRNSPISQEERARRRKVSESIEEHDRDMLHQWKETHALPTRAVQPEPSLAAHQHDKFGRLVPGAIISKNKLWSTNRQRKQLGLEPIPNIEDDAKLIDPDFVEGELPSARSAPFRVHAAMSARRARTYGLIQ